MNEEDQAREIAGAPLGQLMDQKETVLAKLKELKSKGRHGKSYAIHNMHVRNAERSAKKRSKTRLRIARLSRRKNR